MNLRTWAAKWGVPIGAIIELEQQFGVAYEPPSPVLEGKAGSESRVQSLVRLEGAEKGWRLWRNNVGALMDARGIPVRYGLANDSKVLNARIKSADLIGIKPVVITPQHIGQTIGQFASLEVKEEGWTYTGDEHEQAQLCWAQLVAGAGGFATFVNRSGLL